MNTLVTLPFATVLAVECGDVLHGHIFERDPAFRWPVLRDGALNVPRLLLGQVVTVVAQALHSVHANLPTHAHHR